MSCSNRQETPVEKVHWLIHDASFAISQGNLDQAKSSLAIADQMTHDIISTEKVI